MSDSLGRKENRSLHRAAPIRASPAGDAGRLTMVNSMTDSDTPMAGPETDGSDRPVSAQAFPEGISDRPQQPGRANVVGAGLIGGSVGMALRLQGWRVTASDINLEAQAEAMALGAADALGFDHQADLTVLAVPVGAVAEVAREVLDKTDGAVTDVGSTKADICRRVDHPRFVGGHPMAGSEQDGIGGAKPDLFEGAMWVLTPGHSTDEAVFAHIRGLVRSFGAETIALPADVHDALVAQVSHVPHLAAATLMNLADSGSVEHRALLRLAAGGFRDMTRISAGRPSIWPDICVANRTAIVQTLDRLIDSLSSVRGLVDKEDRVGLYRLLDQARTARLNLPVGYGTAEQVAEVVVPIPDRPGELAAITTLAAELDVNILDLEISHSGEGRRGVLTLVVDDAIAERLVGGLIARKYRPSLRPAGRSGVGTGNEVGGRGFDAAGGRAKGAENG